MFKFICEELSLIISPVPANFANTFRNFTLFNYFCHPIGYGGLTCQWKFLPLIIYVHCHIFQLLMSNHHRLNPIFYVGSTIDQSICHILFVEILQSKKGLFLVRSCGSFFLTFQLCLYDFGLSLLVLNFCLEELSFGTLRNLILTLRIPESLCKKYHYGIQ